MGLARIARWPLSRFRLEYFPIYVIDLIVFDAHHLAWADNHSRRHHYTVSSCFAISRHDVVFIGVVCVCVCVMIYLPLSESDQVERVSGVSKVSIGVVWLVRSSSDE